MIVDLFKGYEEESKSKSKASLFTIFKFIPGIILGISLLFISIKSLDRKVKYLCEPLKIKVNDLRESLKMNMKNSSQLRAFD